MTERLNPGFSDEAVARTAALVDWRQGPLATAAWIVVGVTHVDECGQDVDKTVACWLTDTEGHERVPAPDFGVELPPGKRMIIRRPGHLELGRMMELTRGMLWRLQGWNDQIIFEPEVDPLLAAQLRRVVRRKALAVELERAVQVDGFAFRVHQKKAELRAASRG